mgnify:FL=1
MENPLVQLKGKFTKSDVIKFVGRSAEEAWTKQLLNIMLTDVGTVQYRLASGSPTDGDIETSLVPVFDYNEPGEDIDVYGDYNNEGLDDPEEDIVEDTMEHVDVNDSTAVIEKLIEVFEAK